VPGDGVRTGIESKLKLYLAALKHQLASRLSDPGRALTRQESYCLTAAGLNCFKCRCHKFDEFVGSSNLPQVNSPVWCSCDASYVLVANGQPRLSAVPVVLGPEHAEVTWRVLNLVQRLRQAQGTLAKCIVAPHTSATLGTQARVVARHGRASDRAYLHVELVTCTFACFLRT
jgi:hypothetical protein